MERVAVFLVNADDRTGQLKLLREVKPLGFDPALACDYLQCLDSQVKKLGVEEELEALYDELDSKQRKDRLRLIELVGNPMVFFDEGDDEDEEDGESA